MSGDVFQGNLGRTTRVSILVTSDTGDVFTASTYRSINVTADPDLKERLESGALYDVDCPYTSKTYTLALPIIVHDEERKVFALVVPPTLRHKTLALKKDLIEELERSSDPIPSYVVNFQTVFDLADAGTYTSPSMNADISSELEIEKAQLADVRNRFDRERGQMEEVEQRLAKEREEIAALREELESDRQKLAADRLNYESQLIQQSHGLEQSEPVEATQIVTDDQFLEVVDESDATPELLAEASDFSEVEEEFDIVSSTSGLPENLKDLVSAGSRRAVKIVGDQIVAVAQLGSTDLKKLTGAETFFVQLHDVDGYPVVSLMLANLDKEQKLDADVSWPLDVADDGDRLILDKLRRAVRIRVGLYDSAGKLSHGVRLQAPLQTNVQWIVTEATRRLGENKIGPGAFANARNTFLAPTFERLGNMTHNFYRDSFEGVEKPSEVKLAAGIVGYWSTPDMFEYLIANRGFPLHHFREVQDRVVKRGADFGIYLNEHLRARAVEIGVAASDHALCELLIANFAEVGVALKKNDLDDADQWENWDALLTLGEQLGLPPDPDVVELAEASLKRAQDDREIASVPKRANGTAAPEETTMLIQKDLVVAKRSETTGVTYYLPNDAVLDTFDDLSEMSRADLEKLLNDEEGRLEAAQMLVERFGSSATETVMKAAESMSELEVTALARFFETKADGLEGDLVRAMESGGTAATFIAAHALSAVRSASAIPALLTALGDPKRVSDPDPIATAMSHYGKKLMPALMRAIKVEGPSNHFVTLLSRIEDHENGTLADLSKDRSKHLREAAKLARQRRESR